jgi:cytoskeletal protein CcmA (bactofilin family)
VSATWKTNEQEMPAFNPTHDSSRPLLGVAAIEQVVRSSAPNSDQATIGKGLVLSGEITGTESLFIDGKVEGSINLPGNRVTVGRNGKVNANIDAREIVVMGNVRGNVSASDRVDIRAEGALTGDVAAARISIEDGAYFKGGIDIRKSGAKSAISAIPEMTRTASA